MASSPGDGLPPEPPLFDGTEDDTQRATAAELRRRVENRPTERVDLGKPTAYDAGRIDTDRQAMPSAFLPAPPGEDGGGETLPSLLLPAPPPLEERGREPLTSMTLAHMT